MNTLERIANALERIADTLAREEPEEEPLPQSNGTIAEGVKEKFSSEPYKPYSPNAFDNSDNWVPVGNNEFKWIGGSK